VIEALPLVEGAGHKADSILGEVVARASFQDYVLDAPIGRRVERTSMRVWRQSQVAWFSPAFGEASVDGHALELDGRSTRLALQMVRNVAHDLFVVSPVAKEGVGAPETRTCDGIRSTGSPGSRRGLASVGPIATAAQDPSPPASSLPLGSICTADESRSWITQGNEPQQLVGHPLKARLGVRLPPVRHGIEWLRLHVQLHFAPAAFQELLWRERLQHGRLCRLGVEIDAVAFVAEGFVRWPCQESIVSETQEGVSASQPIL
jgi:hypothetical protein